VDAGYGTSSWARSTDGGLTWTEEATPAVAPSTTASPGFEDPGPSGPLQACIDGGPCWRLRDRRAIDRRSPSGEWVEEVAFTDDELADVDTGCAGGSIGILGSIAASGTVDAPQVVAAFGADGALVRGRDGAWDQVRVLTAPPAPAGPVEWTVPVVVASFGPVLGLAIWLVGRRRWPCWPYGLATAAAGWMATLGAIGGLAVLFAPDADPTLAFVAVAVIGTGITTVASILIARLPLRATPVPPVAPRPPPAPPPRLP
jgi:hypothetical protein